LASGRILLAAVHDRIRARAIDAACRNPLFMTVPVIAPNQWHMDQLRAQRPPQLVNATAQVLDNSKPINRPLSAAPLFLAVQFDKLSH
jgi:hypothetical protein